MTRWIGAALLALAACTSFDTINRGVCGNGLLEPGEDCDSSAATCVACAVTCTQATDCPTTDYTCGTDGLCHAPGGAVAAPSAPVTFQVEEYRITDIDRDAIGDVVGASRSSLLVGHGDALGQFATVDSLVTPASTGPVEFGDLDADGSTDVTLTTPDGVVAFTSPYGTLSPFGFESVIGPLGSSGDLRMVFPLGPLGVAGFGVQSNQIVALAVDLANPSVPVSATPCGLTIDPATFSPDSVEVYLVNSGLVGDTVVALASGTSMCVLAFHRDFNILPPFQATPAIIDVTPTIAASVTARPLLADLDPDADGCPHLINTSAGLANLRAWDGSMKAAAGLVPAHCAMAVAGAALPPIGMAQGATQGATAVGHASYAPSGADAPDLVIATDGVYSYAPGAGAAFTKRYSSVRKLSHVASADVDGDGKMDIVASAAGEDDIDVLYRRPAPLFGTTVYEGFRIDTASEVSQLVVGDFDGNGHADVSYVEAAGDHEHLMIAYGGGDWPLPPVEVGTMGAVTSIMKLSIADSADPQDLADDLAVVEPSASAGATLTFLHGSPQRTMIAYFDPRSTAGTNGDLQTSTLFKGSVIGRFKTSTSGTDLPDLIGIAEPSRLTSGTTTTIRAWLIEGQASGLDSSTSDGVTLAGYTPCSGAAPGELCIDDARYLAWSVGTDHDVVVGVDRATTPSAAVVDPWLVTGSSSMLTVTAMPATALTNAIHSKTLVQSLRSADLDGDGSPELIAAFAPAAKAPASERGAVLVCAMANGIPSSCQDVVPAIAAVTPTTTQCLDAAPGRVSVRGPTMTPTAASDLVVLCRDDGSTLYRVSHAADGYAAEVIAHSNSPLTRIEVGDVTGDGVADIVAQVNQSGAKSLQVFRQCTSSELATCGRTP